MNWWMVLLGVVLLIPALLIVIALYVSWLTLALDAANQAMRESLSSNQEVLGTMYWGIHLVGVTGLGVWLLGTGLGL